MAKQYWLMKCEPSAYDIHDLEKDGVTSWEGVRNYQARNIMRDEMRKGDPVLFYASNANPSGVTGLAKIAKEGYPDHHAFEPGHKYFDEKSDPDDPRWFMVDIEFVRAFDETISLAELKDNPRLAGMMVTKKGSRLSVQPVSREHYEEVVRMAKDRKKKSRG